MKVKFPITIIEPGVYNPFSQSAVEVTKEFTAEVDSDSIAGLFPVAGPSATPPLMSASELATKYTSAELMAALTIALTPKIGA